MLTLSPLQELNVTFVVRDVCLAILVVLLHHYLSSIRMEVDIIWRDRPSFRKYCYLVSRHLPIVFGLMAFFPLSGFKGYTLSNTTCAWLLSSAVTMLYVAMALGNTLRVLHVIRLWDYDRRISAVMLGAFFITYGAAFVTVIASLVNMRDAIIWNEAFSMCVVVRVDSLMIAVAAIPLGFEAMMMAAILWNAVDRPRQANIALRHTLLKDGIVFFLLTVLFRVAQVILVSTLDPALSILSLIASALAGLLSVIFNQRAIFEEWHADCKRNHAARQPIPYFDNIMARNAARRGTPPWTSEQAVKLGEMEVDVHVD